MGLGDDRFRAAGAAFEVAVRKSDPEETQRAHAELIESLDGASPEVLAQGCRRLADLLDEVPPGVRANIANVIGAYAQTSADAVACAPRILANLAKTLDHAREFAERWKATTDDDLPDPETTDVDEAMLDQFGLRPLMAWWTLANWISPALAVLQHREVRKLFGRKGCEMLSERHNALAEVSGRWHKELAYMLLILDDEPLVALHRETGTGYRLRMSGIGDNFQLHTLLADALIGGQHLPGEPPSAEAVAMCRDVEGQVLTVGSFNLVAPDGTWIWNEGTPADIPVVEGTRLLVLDPPPYQRNWPAGRYFPFVPADLVLERVLTAEETAAWFTHVAPADTAEA